MNLDSEFWLSLRRAILCFLDGLEKDLISKGFLKSPTTAQIRKWWKEQEK